MRNPFISLTKSSILYNKDIMEKMAFLPKNINTMTRAKSGQTPKEIVHKENKLKLYHYKPLTDKQHDTPVLFVYSLINKPYILDLQRDRSVVRKFLENGFNVYLTDWGDPSHLDSTLSLDDYANWYIDKCVNIIKKRNNVEKINILGYCMGGTLSAIYSSIYPEKVKNLLLLAAGLDFEKSGGILSRWSAEPFFDESDIPEVFGGNISAEFLDMGFVLMEPVNNLFTKYFHLYDDFDDEEFVKLFARMEKWLRDGVDLSGKAYIEFIDDLYQHNKLTKNKLYLGGNHVNIKNIDMPVLQIIGTKDHIVPPETSKPFNQKIPSKDTEIYELESGHEGLAMSPKAHRKLWPNVCDWLKKQLNQNT